ncbi:MAG: hypothetical protein A2452_07310 [Candidatus Firestonebacteria bacterium RIFOXYC2_FULL_39_67]|nr:MAG: hypothetical protein A2452_07310 [Candidatus Firestonebacteria bacterium RIFOXYC2_FULL_39_67]
MSETLVLKEEALAPYVGEKRKILSNSDGSLITAARVTFLGSFIRNISYLSFWKNIERLCAYGCSSLMEELDQNHHNT